MVLMDSSTLSHIKEGITFLTFSYLVFIFILFFFHPHSSVNIKLQENIF
jgi:hypothetical protein